MKLQSPVHVLEFGLRVGVTFQICRNQSKYFARVLVTKVEEQQIMVFLDEMKIIELCSWFSQEVICCLKLLDLSSDSLAPT